MATAQFSHDMSDLLLPLKIVERFTVLHEYDSPLRSLRPCWTAFLRILRVNLHHTVQK